MQKKKTELTEDGNFDSREIWLDENTISEISKDSSSDDDNEIINEDVE